MNTNGAVPGLAVILVGERPDSEKYVSMKKKLAEKVHTETVRQGDTWRVMPRSYLPSPTTCLVCCRRFGSFTTKVLI